MMRYFSILLIVLLTGCQPKVEPALSLPPLPEPTISATITTIPYQDGIMFMGEKIGQSPATLLVHTLDQLTDGLTIASAPEGVVEKRIKVIDENRVEVTLVLDHDLSKMTRALGLTKILVFDYGEEITFDFNKSELKPELRPLLGKQAEVLNNFFKGVEIHICGHSDSRGSRQRNLEISLERAMSVYNELLLAGVPGANMKVQGFGSDFPLVTNETEAGRARNRRIEIILGR
ncbi:MAG: OmpA family protein [Holophagaceae bacterium]|nr:OmpA family protein [Holophagaceae bacterium]